MWSEYEQKPTSFLYSQKMGKFNDLQTRRWLKRAKKMRKRRIAALQKRALSDGTPRYDNYVSITHGVRDVRP